MTQRPEPSLYERRRHGCGKIDPVERPLCETDNYCVEADDEEVVLSGPNVPERLVIGDFYGSAYEAIIDARERGCVMVGCGLIVYRLGPPWAPYTYPGPLHDSQKPAKPNDCGLSQVVEGQQWWEFGREPPKPLWLKSLDRIAGERFEVSSVEEPEEGPTRWAVLAESKIVRPLNWLPELL